MTKITGSWCIGLCYFPGVILRYTLCVLCASVVNSYKISYANNDTQNPDALAYALCLALDKYKLSVPPW